MNKDFKNHLLNIGGIVIFSLLAILFFSFAIDQPIILVPGTRYLSGENIATIALPLILGSMSVYLLYKETKLLLHLYSLGGMKIRIGCLLAVIIPITICIISFITTVQGVNKVRENESTTMMAMTNAPYEGNGLYGDKGNGIYKIGTEIGAGKWYFDVQDCSWDIIGYNGNILKDQSTRIDIINDVAFITLRNSDKEFRNNNCGQLKYFRAIQSQ